MVINVEDRCRSKIESCILGCYNVYLSNIFCLDMWKPGTNISNIYFRCHRSQTNKQTNKQTSNNHNLQRVSWNLHWIQKRHVYSMYQPVKLVIGFGVLRWCPWKYKKKYISTKRKHKINNIELRKNEFRKLMLKARMTLQKLQFYTPNFGANSHLCVVHYRQLKA